MKFDFWDNYQNMLSVIVWKHQFIKPIWYNCGVPLKIVNLSTGKYKQWALISRLEGEVEIVNINVDYSKRGSSLNKRAMRNLVDAYFEAYRSHLTSEKPE